MSFTNNSAKFSRAKQINNTKMKEKKIDHKLNNARKNKITNYYQNSSPVRDTTIARNTKIQKSKDKQIGNLKRLNGKVQKNLEMHQQNQNRSSRNSPSPNDDNYQKLLKEKKTNSTKCPSQHRYTQRTIMIAALLILTSLPCYNLLRKFDIWPSSNAVKARLLASYFAATEQLINLDNLKTTVENYRKENNANGKIKAILATDAVSLTPEIGISKKVLVTGLLQSEFLKESEMRNGKILKLNLNNLKIIAKEKRMLQMYNLSMQQYDRLLASFTQQHKEKLLIEK